LESQLAGYGTNTVVVASLLVEKLLDGSWIFYCCSKPVPMRYGKSNAKKISLYRNVTIMNFR